MSKIDTFLQPYSFIYDFAIDGGEIGTISMKQWIPAESVVWLGMAKVVTALTSGGAATISIGWATSTSALMAAAPVASFTINGVVEGVGLATAMVNTTDTARQLQMTIATATLLTGKLVYSAFVNVVGPV